MKKLLLPLLVVIFTCFSITAQEYSFGLKAGFNSLSIRASAQGVSASESASGFYIGFFSEFQLTEKFNIQPELQFISVSENGQSSNVFALPIMAKFKTDEKFSILAGPQLDLILDEDAEGIKKLGLGLGAGLSYDIDKSFVLEGRYVLGLSNRLEDNNIDGIEVEAKFNYLQFGIGYKF